MRLIYTPDVRLEFLRGFRGINVILTKRHSIRSLITGGSFKKHNPRERSYDGDERTRSMADKERTHTRKLSNPKVSTISQNYNEKTMLLSSDDE
mgnify:CR=1 FL=1